MSINELEAGSMDWAKLLQFEVSTEDDDFSDLYWTVVSYCDLMGLHNISLPFLDKLVASPKIAEATEHWPMVARCYSLAGLPEAATTFYYDRMEGMSRQDAR